MSIIGEYISEQNGIFYSHINKIIKNAIPERSGVIAGKNSETIIWNIVFKDNSILRTLEVLEINGDEINKKKYGYEYSTPSGFFFYYEFQLETDRISTVDKLWKPKYHLHVGVKKNKSSLIKDIPEQLIDHRGPHYKVASIEINEIVGMIVVNFFSDNQELVEKLKICSF